MEQANVTVIGAGVVGMATAVMLQRDGHAVTVVDRGEPGEETSFGNAGSIAPGSIIPMAMPGTIAKAMTWMRDPLGPVSLRLGYVPKLLPWLWHFHKASNQSRAEASAAAMRTINGPSVDLYRDLMREAGTDDLLRTDGMLHVFKSSASFDASAVARRMRTDNGVKLDVVSGDEIRQMEPSLSPQFGWGFFMPEEGHVRSPVRIVKTLAALFERNGGSFRRADVRGFAMGPEGPTALQTSDGEIPVDHLVIAAGVWSREMARQLGTKVPLEAERGYHIEIPEPGVAPPRRPITSADGKFVATPMEGGLRFAGTAEFAGLGGPENWKRTEALEHHARDMFPGITVSGHSRWMGNRPSTPDSLPVIARAPRHARVYFAFGHGHWGLMAAPMTGQLVSDLVASRAPRVTLEPFRPDRFGG